MQWEAILDNESVEVHTHGMVITCADGLARWFYLRIFMYSADYPEKSVQVQSILFSLLETSFTHIVGRVLLAGIKNLENHPCPRCLIPLADASISGMAHDAKR